MNPHLGHSSSLREMLASVLRSRHLIAQMVKREVIGRYRGSMLGLAWSFFNPVLMLAVYTFFFSVIFKARWSGLDDSDKGGFAILVFVGMIVHGLFAECLNKAPTLIINNASYVKKVVFPLEILPWISMGSAMFHMAISLVVLLAARIILGGALSWTIIFFPLVLFPLVLVTIGFAWLFAAVGVYLRDVAQTVGIFTTVLTFLSPVFYPISVLPERYHFWFRLNPLTSIIEESRNVLIWNRLPDWGNLALMLLVSGLIAWFGFWVFQRCREGFADVI